MSTRYRNLADYKSGERGGVGRIFRHGEIIVRFGYWGGEGYGDSAAGFDCKTTESNLISGIRQTNGGDCRDNVKYRLT